MQGQMTLDERLRLRLMVEEFLYHEADLLDRWQLQQWRELFVADGRYVVPTPDQRDFDLEYDLMLISEDTDRLEGRVDRLLSTYAHIENPKSRLRHSVSNVKIVSSDADTVHVRAGFCVYRCRVAGTNAYSGEYTYELRRDGESFRIVRKIAMLDHETLRDVGGVLSIIL
jgi:p-cumate 2,3-dioxygenase beta subunit